MSLSYVMLGSNDVVKSRVFYDSVLPIIGGEIEAEYMPDAFCFKLLGGGRIWVIKPFNKQAASSGNGNMIGLMCRSKVEVQQAHDMALSKGAKDEGSPGPRPQYGPDFFGAYVRDLDGNKLSFVYFGLG